MKWKWKSNREYLNLLIAKEILLFIGKSVMSSEVRSKGVPGSVGNKFKFCGFCLCEHCANVGS